MNNEERHKMSHDEVCEYIKGMKEGERVVETGSSCQRGHQGYIYFSKKGDCCIKWDDRGQGRMGTSFTHGARRVSEVDVSEYVVMIEDFVNRVKFFVKRVEDEKEVFSKEDKYDFIGHELGRINFRMEASEDEEEKQKLNDLLTFVSERRKKWATTENPSN